MVDDEIDNLADNESSGSIKKPYVKPQLAVYGTVEQLTQGGDAGQQDGDATGNSFGGGL